MKFSARMFLCAALLFTLGLCAVGAGDNPATTTGWPSFRGWFAGGIADGYSTPVQWNVDQAQNVEWKVPIPGMGHSSPVVFGDRIFITTAVKSEGPQELKVGLYGDITPVEETAVYSWKVYCLDRKTGQVIWDRTAHTGVPKIKRHPKSTHANPTPATDGKHLVAYFGSEGLYCYDYDGKLLWSKDLGVLESGYYVVPSALWGTGSSPVIYEDAVYLQCDVLKNPFIAAFSLEDGKEIWRTVRNDVPTWSTPTIHKSGDRVYLIVNGCREAAGYDAKTGTRLWYLGENGDIPVPTPVVADDLVYITNAHGQISPIYAVRLTATGDITLKGLVRVNQHIAWSEARAGAYMQTPIVYGGYLYVCQDSGVLSCYEANTGKRVYQTRLGSGATGFSASGVAADGKLYYTSEEGDVYVVKAGPPFQLLATNPIGEICMATPAISEGVLYFRTQAHLVAIRQK
ncbi:MAG TPA: PQQ-binding-like beta-propeller repeat protein [Acidobacteriota bacterium]|nr:PQQ-binding-like beta-propeller repeat protein [Acidobacteriota bacterium]